MQDCSNAPRQQSSWSLHRYLGRDNNAAELLLDLYKQLLHLGIGLRGMTCSASFSWYKPPWGTSIKNCTRTERRNTILVVRSRTNLNRPICYVCARHCWFCTFNLYSLKYKMLKQNKMTDGNINIHCCCAEMVTWCCCWQYQMIVGVALDYGDAGLSFSNNGLYRSSKSLICSVTSSLLASGNLSNQSVFSLQRVANLVCRTTSSWTQYHTSTGWIWKFEK